MGTQAREIEGGKRHVARSYVSVVSRVIYPSRIIERDKSRGSQGNLSRGKIFAPRGTAGKVSIKEKRRLKGFAGEFRAVLDRDPSN